MENSSMCVCVPVDFIFSTAGVDLVIVELKKHINNNKIQASVCDFGSVSI